MATATTTAAPAAETKGKRGRKSAAELAELPPLDLSALTVKTGVAMPKQERAKASNPFIEHVKDSYEFEDARAVTIAVENVGRVESMIRRAADALEVGVSVHKSEPEDGNVTITFAAKDWRKRKTADEATAETVTPASE